MIYDISIDCEWPWSMNDLQVIHLLEAFWNAISGQFSAVDNISP